MSDEIRTNPGNAVKTMNEGEEHMEVPQESGEPRIIAFLCNWCSYAGADLAGTSRLQYPPNVRIVRVMCSGRVNPLIIIKSLLEGADGVLVSGCHPGDCHYQEGNMFTRRRMEVLTRLLPFYGIDPRRFRASWVSASEGGKFAEIVTRMTEELREMKRQEKGVVAIPDGEIPPAVSDGDRITIAPVSREGILEKMLSAGAALVERDDVKYVIGYEQAPLGGVRPLFVHDPGDAQRLVFSPQCHHNLVSYLPGEDKLPLPRGAKPDDRKIGIFVKPCDSKALNQLLAERGIKREDVFVIGLECHGINGDDENTIKDKCLRCQPSDFEYDEFIGDPGSCGPAGTGEIPVPGSTNENAAHAEGTGGWENEELADRWGRWQEEFSKCIRCYACRNVCPLCNCEDCFVDRLDPQWVERGTDTKTNAEYLIMRAYHLAGRCIECGACEEACPVDIPHMDVKLYMADVMKELFGDEVEAGRKKEGKSVLCDHDEDDRGDDFW